MIVCIAEDRASCEASVELLLLSLSRHCAELPVYLIFPPASAAFISWIKGYPNVTLIRSAIPNSSSWNVKPQVMLTLMDRGNKDIIWIDSDIIVLRSISRMFGKLDVSTFVVTEEALSGRYNDYGGERARRWGLKVGRSLPFAVNSGIIRATTVHRPLLERWRELLESEQYREAQSIDWRARPWHMLTDQDSLTALLSADEYSGIPIKALKRGRDIIQYFGPLGYTVTERVSNIVGRRPTFVHSQGPKPWLHHWEKVPMSDIGQYIRAIYLDLSPYTLAAQGYRRNVNNGTDWMRTHFALSTILRAAGFWYPPLVGLPIAIIWDVQSIIKRTAKSIWGKR